MVYPPAGPLTKVKAKQLIVTTPIQTATCNMPTPWLYQCFVLTHIITFSHCVMHFGDSDGPVLVCVIYWQNEYCCPKRCINTMLVSCHL